MEHWVTMSEASKATGLSIYKISRLGKSGKLETKRDTLDSRIRLVDVNALQRLIDASVLARRTTVK